MFAAIISRTPEELPREYVCPDALIGALTPFAAPDEVGVWQDNHALIVHALHHNTASSLHESTPEICRETGLIIASWVRLDNRADLCAKLGLRARDDLTDPQIILAAYRHWGRDCASHLEGDFSFVIHDPQTRETYCARDSIGTRPFYYFVTDQHFIAATSVAAIKAIPGIHLTPSKEWIALLASGFMFADGETAYEGGSKLRPGHDLRVAPDSTLEPHQYFEFDLVAPHATKRDPEWVERYRDAFNRAVDVRAHSNFLIASDNSGGLDSASIIARLVEVLPHDIADFHTFALVGHQQELDLLDELSAMCGIDHVHTDIRPEMLGIDDAVKRAHTAIGHPPEHGQSILSAGFFEQAQALGIRTMMSGFGGDEIVTGYAKYLMDELQARGEWRAMFGEIEGPLPRRVVRFAHRLASGPYHPDDPMRTVMEKKLEVSCLSHAFLEDTGLRSRIKGWMLPERGELTLNSVAALDPGFRHSRTSRLEASALFAATYAIEYRYPLFDRRLIQQFLHTPSIEKGKGSLGRYLHRRAVAGRIPDSIAWQQSKDMGPPLDGQFRFDNHAPISFDDLPSQARDMFDRKSFETGQALLSNAEDPMDPDVMRTRYFTWQVRQLMLWLENA